MILFWLLCGAATAAMAVVVFWRARLAADHALAAVAPPSSDRGELDELDRLRDRGLIDPGAHAEARAEAARRLLRSTPSVAPLDPALGTGRHDRALLLAGVGLAAVLALGTYALTGRPGVGDQPYAQRVAEWAVEIDTLDAPRLAAVAGRAAGDRPNPEAQAFLGRARLEAGDPLGAASAFRRSLTLRPNHAETWGRLGEALVLANDGTIGGDAETAFARALELDPTAQPPRFFLGQAALERGDRERAAQLWQPLIESLPADDPRRAPLLAALEAGA